MAAIDILLQEALTLSPDERAELAKAILASLIDEEDHLDEEDRRRLHAALERAHEEMRAGRVRPAQELLDKLRARSSR